MRSRARRSCSLRRAPRSTSSRATRSAATASAPSRRPAAPCSPTDAPGAGGGRGPALGVESRYVAEQTSDGAAAPTEATRTPRRRDLPVEGQLLLLITLGLTAIGQVMVYSASSPVAMTTARYGNDPLYFVKNGVVFTIGGVLLMLLVMRMPVALFKALAPLALVVSLVLL